jgi:hypothetical protein
LRYTAGTLVNLLLLWGFASAETPPTSIAFIQQLAEEGNHAEAALECRRFLFFAPQSSDASSVRFLLVRELLRAGKPADAGLALQAYLSQEKEGKHSAEATYMLGNCSILLGQPVGGENYYSVVKDKYKDSVWGERAALRLGLLRAGEKNWRKAHEEFSWVVEKKGNLKAIGEELDSLALTGEKLPQRSTEAGMILSAVLPGAGQAYSGRWGDAAAALLLTAGFGALAVTQYLDKQYVGAGVLGFVFISFYAGNIYNGGDSAYQFNRREELRLKEKMLHVAEKANLDGD